MKMLDIQKIAIRHGIDPFGKSRTDLIRETQRKEGNFECYGTAVSGCCDQTECCWRSLCLGEKSPEPRIRYYSTKYLLAQMPFQYPHEGDKQLFTILMVDDDEDDCVLLEEALREIKLKCRLLCLPDGMKLMDYLGRREKQNNGKNQSLPDLIFLDINMPAMNGREVLNILKSDPTLRRVPVIMLTTSGDEDDIRACYDIGANSYVVKPATFESLTLLVESISRYWFETVRLPDEKNGQMLLGPRQKVAEASRPFASPTGTRTGHGGKLQGFGVTPSVGPLVPS